MSQPMPDDATPASATHITDRELADIPFARVQAALLELLDLDSLEYVREVQIGVDVIRAVVQARGEDGRLFLDGDDVATYVLARRVVRG